MAKPSATTSKPVTTGATTPQPSADGTDAHWADQIADLIVDGVDRVRDRTVTPAQALAKYVVYGAVSYTHLHRAADEVQAMIAGAEALGQGAQAVQ